MPCESAYLAPWEKELQRAAKLYAYALKALNQPVSPVVNKVADDIYGWGGANFVPALCALVKGMSDEEREAIVYNPHNRDSRDLANWWEEHQEADRAREKQEAFLKKQQELRDSALSKLSSEERQALKDW